MNKPTMLLNFSFFLNIRGIFFCFFLLFVSTIFFSCENKSAEEINLENRVNNLLETVVAFDEKSDNQMISDSIRILKISVNEIDSKDKEYLINRLDKISFKIDSLDKVLYKKIEGVYSNFQTKGYESAENMLSIVYDSSKNILYVSWTFFSNNQPFMMQVWSNGKMKIFRDKGEVILNYIPYLDAFGNKESAIYKQIKSGKLKNPFIYKFNEENGSMNLLQQNLKEPEGTYNGQKLTKINSPKRNSKTIEFYRKMFK
jgi:hypothetical protein